MPDVLPSRSRPARSYASLALFVVVYLVVLGVVFAPKDLIGAQSASEVGQSD